MASDWQTVVDAIVADLTASGRPLNGATVHKYLPSHPQKGQHDNKRHVAVWPAGEGESPQPLATGAHALQQTYIIQVWETTKTEGSRLEADDTANKAWLTLHNAIRARLYVAANQTIGGSDLAWYGGSQFDDEVSSVRTMRLLLNVRRFIAFTS